MTIGKKIRLFAEVLFLSIGMTQVFAQHNSQNNKKFRVYEVYPGQDLPSKMDSLEPGDQLVLHEGTYEGSLLIKTSGRSDFPIIIRGYGNGETRPVLNYEGTTASLIQIEGSNLVLDFLQFQSKETYGIRIRNSGKGANNITIKNCVFNECGGGDISANDYNVTYSNIQVLNNYFRKSKRTPVYIGRHPGTTFVTNFVFRRNIVDGSQNDGPWNTIGYGIELKLNVTKSIIEDNYFVGTKGPGIMVYGSNKKSSGYERGKMLTTNKQYSNIIRNNIIVDAGRKDTGYSAIFKGAAIVVGGGPSIVQNNVVIRSGRGIYVQNYRDWGNIDNISVTNNTLIDNMNQGIITDSIPSVITKNNIFDKKGITKMEFSGIPEEDNRIFRLDESEKQKSQKVRNVVPDPGNIGHILKVIKSGPLDRQQVNRLLDTIVENSAAL